MSYDFRINLIENVRQATRDMRVDFGLTGKVAEKSSSKIKGALSGVQTGIRKTVSASDGAKRSFSLFGKTLNIGSGKVGGYRDKIGSLGSKLKGFVGDADRANRAAKRLNNTFGGLSVGNVLTGNLLASGVEGMVSGVVNSFADIPDLAMKTDALNESIKFSGAEEGENNLRFLEGMIEKYSLPALTTRDSFSKLSGSFMGTELAGGGMRDIFEGVASAARALNMDTEQMDGTFTALGQMMSKGKVSAEELNGQLGERLPGALGIAADAMGVTKAELMKMMEQGKLMSEDFLPKFAEQLKTTFGEQAVKAADMLPSKIQKLKNSLDVLKIEAFEALEPLISKAVDFATVFVRSIGSVKDDISGLVNDVLTFVKPIGRELFGMGMSLYQGMLPILTTLKPMIQGLSVPISNVVSALGGVFDILSPILSDIVTTFLEAFNGSNVLGGSFNMLSQVITGVGQALGFVFGLLKPLLKGLAWVAGSSLKLFLKLGNTIGNLVGKLLEKLFGALNKVFGFVDKVSRKLGRGGFDFRLQMPDLPKEGVGAIPLQPAKESGLDFGVPALERPAVAAPMRPDYVPERVPVPSALPAVRPTPTALPSASTVQKTSERKVFEVIGNELPVRTGARERMSEGIGKRETTPLTETTNRGLTDEVMQGQRSDSGRNVNINMKVEKWGDVNITTNKINESGSKIKAMFNEWFLEALNDAGHVAFN